MDTLKDLVKQPYWVIALILGALMVTLPCVTVGKDNQWTMHEPATLLPVWVGLALLVISSISFGFTLLSDRSGDAQSLDAGLDLTRVKETRDVLWTTVNGCEIRAVEGRIEDYPIPAGAAIALPCNEYFDDRCAQDTGSALGAYANKTFDGQLDAFVSLIKREAATKLGPGTEQQKTDDDRVVSYGAGRCLLLMKPLGRSTPVALVATTTQRAGQGLVGRLSYLFAGMRELVTRLSDERLTEVVMPVLASGHGGIDPPLAFVGLLLAIAEAARYREGGRRLSGVTIVVFKADADAGPLVDRIIVRRALALIGSPGR
jgi:hypothetical protein